MIFLAVYGAMFLVNLLVLPLVLRKWWRELRTWIAWPDAGSTDRHARGARPVRRLRDGRGRDRAAAVRPRPRGRRVLPRRGGTAAPDLPRHGAGPPAGRPPQVAGDAEPHHAVGAPSADATPALRRGASSSTPPTRPSCRCCACAGSRSRCTSTVWSGSAASGGAAGRRYYRFVESLSVRWADALIADASGIADYYTSEFGARHGAVGLRSPVQDAPGAERVTELDLEPKRYHLVVARFEPENHVLEIVEGYAASRATTAAGRRGLGSLLRRLHQHRGRHRRAGSPHPLARRGLGPGPAR